MLNLKELRKTMLTLHKASKLLTLCLWLLLTACGGGGSESPQPQPDTSPPVITLNGDSAISLFLDDAYEELGASATDNIDGTVAVVISGTVDTSTLGEYTITYSANDNAGNTSSVTRTVSVIEPPDTIPPVITLNGDSTIILFIGETYTELGATALDDKNGVIAVTISGTVDSSTLGDYALIYTATDSAGNASSVTRTVSVILPPDTTPPVITLNGNTTINVVVSESYNELGATAIDERDGVVDISISGFVDTAIIGTYHITYTATDSDGNSVSAERTVVVVSSATNRPFITTWKTNNPGISGHEQIVLQTSGTGYDYTVNWGDGTTDEHVTGDITHTYQEMGTYTVTITGDFPQSYFAKTNVPSLDIFKSDSLKLLSIEQWGDIKWQSMHMAFYGCEYLEGNALDTPNLTDVTDMSYMLYEAKLFNQDLSNWDVSSVTNMADLFNRAEAFNQDINSWDVSSVTNMSGMFSGTKVFNQELSSWDVSSVTNMNSMFASSKVFNQSLSAWDVSSVTDMRGMFISTVAFNQDLSNWDVSSVTTMFRMFENTIAFNQELSSWDVSSVTNMGQMFAGHVAYTDSFNQNLSNWNVSSVTNMSEMFRDSKSFNQDVSSWDVSSVTNMNGMFRDSKSFNQALNSWDVSSVTNMSAMFAGAEAFNQALNNWDVSSVTQMSIMFASSTVFNQDISSWDVSSVTIMNQMFLATIEFNQDLSNWDVSSVTDMESMLVGTSLSTDNYDELLIGWCNLPLQQSVVFGLGDIKYSSLATAARDVLTNTYGWIITDGGVAN